MKRIFFYLFLTLSILFHNLTFANYFPCIKINLDKVYDRPLQSNETIRFNFVKLGDIKSKTIYVENAGTSTYLIQSISFLNNGLGVFSFSSNPNLPVSLNPNEAIFITLNFQPDRISKFFDTLLIHFTEPFDFIYLIPIEGTSFINNSLFIKDTSEFVGTNNFTIPIYLKGDTELSESINLDFNFSVCTNSKVFFIDRITNGTIIDNTFNNTFQILTLNFNNCLIDSSTKVITYLIGKLLLAEQDTTVITLDNIDSEIPGVTFSTENGTLQLLGICVSDISLIDFENDWVNISVPDLINSENLKIRFEFSSNKERYFVINFYDLLGNLIASEIFSLEPEVVIPISVLPNGIYQLNILFDKLKYSKKISVIK